LIGLEAPLYDEQIHRGRPRRTSPIL